ncbi:hypothetical protein EYR38_009075 [Pleurotus pulmonarius]|nr:hypothetical protein EYR38_009075 [Pleurotus pulmonarius]
MDTADPRPAIEGPELTWINVALAFSFIVFNVVLSSVLRLDIGNSLLIASARCVVQLGVVALLLQKVFEARDPWIVAAIVCVLNILGTFETVVNKSSRRHQNMFASTLLGMMMSCVPVSIVGTRFAMSLDPFWEPVQYIPIIGMLCGNTVSGIVVSGSYLLRELDVSRDKVEMYLAFGATRAEASKPIVIEALRLALMPTINQMSVLGIISIPGMMTGAILGGASVERAAKLQMIIMFMICASTALASMFTTLVALRVVLDCEHRIRDDRVDNRPHFIWRLRGLLWMEFLTAMQKLFHI